MDGLTLIVRVQIRCVGPQTLPARSGREYEGQGQSEDFDDDVIIPLYDQPNLVPFLAFSREKEHGVLALDQVDFWVDGRYWCFPSSWMEGSVIVHLVHSRCNTSAGEFRARFYFGGGGVLMRRKLSVEEVVVDFQPVHRQRHQEDRTGQSSKLLVGCYTSVPCLRFSTRHEKPNLDSSNVIQDYYNTPAHPTYTSRRPWARQRIQDPTEYHEHFILQQP